MWERIVTKLLLFALACPFLVVGWIGVSLAANPNRYKAELEVPGEVEKLPKFQRGPLTGWYVYVYVGEERVVCANPTAWDGPKVITCTHVVAIDSEKAEPPVAQAVGPLASYVPEIPAPGEDPYTNMVLDEIDLLNKRLSFRTRNAERDR
jgi:hypothetical protein